jgi:hypothetical protein
VNTSNTVSTNTRISTGQTKYRIGYTEFIEPKYHKSLVKTKLQFHILNMEKIKIKSSLFVNVSFIIWYMGTRLSEFGMWTQENITTGSY